MASAMAIVLMQGGVGVGSNPFRYARREQTKGDRPVKDGRPVSCVLRLQYYRYSDFSSPQDFVLVGVASGQPMSAAPPCQAIVLLVAGLTILVELLSV